MEKAIKIAPDNFSIYISRETIYLSEGKFDKAWLENYLAGREREAHVFAAPALGLTLVDVKYPDASEYAKRIAETLQVRDSDGAS